VISRSRRLRVRRILWCHLWDGIGSLFRGRRPPRGKEGAKL